MGMQGVSVASQHSLNLEAAISANESAVAKLTMLKSQIQDEAKKAIILTEIGNYIDEEYVMGDLSITEMRTYPNKVKQRLEEFNGKFGQYE